MCTSFHSFILARLLENESFQECHSPNHNQLNRITKNAIKTKYLQNKIIGKLLSAYFLSVILFYIIFFPLLLIHPSVPYLGSLQEELFYVILQIFMITVL